MRLSPLMYKTGVCLRYLNPLLQYRSVAKLPTVTQAQTLCSSGRGSRPVADRDHRQTDRQNVIKHKGQRDGQTERGANGFMTRDRPTFPKSAAGTSWKTAVDDQQRRGETGRLAHPDRPLSPADWRKLKEALANPNRFEYRMMASLIYSRAELDIAKSLLAFVATETGDLTYELLLRYLTLCVNDGHDAEVLDLYGIMKGRFEKLDPGASTLFIKAFSRTEGWREALSILQQLHKVITPTAKNYSDIIDGAILHGDIRAAWSLYDEVLEKGLCPRQETWEALFRGGVWVEEWTEEGRESMSHQEYQERLFSILLYMRDNQLYPQEALASTIKTWFESLPGQNWKGSWTTINSKGVCVCCSSELESICLTSVEHEELKKKVITDVILGRDVFKKTTPEEVDRFMKFVNRRPAFDVVIDGLNIGNLNRGSKSGILLMVVSELKRRGLKVLVLGKDHMLKSPGWNRQDMTLIKQKAQCFYTSNISEDDPFLLYASLNSGNQCCFMSRDMMRDHRACLPEGPLRQLFFKWQRGHQMMVDMDLTSDGRTVSFMKIPSYDTIIQTSGDSWHIPYHVKNNWSSFEVPQKWLCLTKTN